jgi:hypothetical protein
MDGLLGFRPALDRLIVQPHLPETWQWVAVRKFPYAGSTHSLFYYLGTIYSTLDVQSGYRVELFEEDVTDQIECNAYAIALRRGEELTIFISVPERQGVRLRLLPPLVEQERVMEFLMNPGSAQVVTLHVAPKHIAPAEPSPSEDIGVHVEPAAAHLDELNGAVPAFKRRLARPRSVSRRQLRREAQPKRVRAAHTPSSDALQREAAVVEHQPVQDSPEAARASEPASSD